MREGFDFMEIIPEIVGNGHEASLVAKFFKADCSKQ